MKRIMKKLEEELTIELKGTENLHISFSNKWECGGEKGFGINETGQPGGVLPNREAIKLAIHILSVLSKDYE